MCSECEKNLAAKRKIEATLAAIRATLTVGQHGLPYPTATELVNRVLALLDAPPAAE